MVLILSGAPSLTGCVVQLLGCHGYNGKPVQPIAAFSQAAWFHEAAEITDVVEKPSASWCPIPSPTILKTPELSSLMGILTSSPRAAQLNDYDLVLLPPDYVLCHRRHLPPPFSLRLTAWCRPPSGQQRFPVYHSDTITLSRPLSQHPLFQLHCPFLSLSSPPPPLIVKKTIPFLRLWLYKYSSQLSHRLSASPSPLCLFTMF